MDATKVRLESSTHWYARDGSPVYQVTGKNGQLRDTTLRDAKARGDLVPGVTGIIKCQDRPALTSYLIEQHMLACLTLPRRDGESERDWMYRVKEDAKEHARKAAEEGTRIHDAIQAHFEGTAPPGDYWPHVKATVAAIHENCGNHAWIPERSFAHPMGYAGRCDLSTDNMGANWVLDFKGKDFSPEEAGSLKAWDDHAQQLGAYRHGLGLHGARCAIVYVSRNHPGAVAFCEVDEDDLRRGFDMFQALLAYWKAKNRYDPSFYDKDAA